MSKTHLGHTARKRFGQNFLHDAYVIDQIVAAINPQPGENLVEIGPGLGAITEPVCEIADKLTVVELDRDLAERLRTHPFISQKLTIVEADAMKFDFATLAEQQPIRLFGNLPYNISTPLMFHLFEFTGKVQDMHFMLQKEVVDRLAAGPGGKSYGRLSVMTQYYCKVIPVLQVPPGAFKPAPKVDSAVVKLVPKAASELTANDVSVLNKVTTAAFGQRRKTLRNSLQTLISEAELTSIGIDPTQRAEKISLSQFVTIANAVSAKNPDVSE